MGVRGPAFGPPLPRDLCQILSKSMDCALRARAFTALKAGSSTLPYRHEILKNPMVRKAGPDRINFILIFILI